ncbi:unnamed protein product [Parajaminaea phylloscopi]
MVTGCIVLYSKRDETYKRTNARTHNCTHDVEFRKAPHLVRPIPFTVTAQMAVSPVVNVARYSALVGGIAYGVVHHRTLQQREDKRYAQAEWKRKEDLIKQAKEAYKTKLATQAQASKAGAVVTDPESPNFDLEKFLNSLDK